MEQRQDDIDPSDAGVDGDGAVTEEEPLIKRHFLLLLALALGVAGVAGAGVTYAQYDRVGETIRSIPYVGQIAQNPGKVPYTDQIVGMLPYVGGDDSGEESESKKLGSTSKLKGLVVNPAGSQGNRYLAISIVFETGSPKVRTELEDKRVVIKDAVLRLLSERTVEELSDPTQRDDLKKALRDEANGILSKGEVDGLYFTEFVLQ